jgi:hypothetical protein
MPHPSPSHPSPHRPPGPHAPLRAHHQPLAAQLAPRDFGEELHEQVRKAPWVIASLAFHGVVAVVFLSIPASVVPVVETAHVLSTPQDAPIELAPEPEKEKEKKVDVDVPRVDRTDEVIDAPVRPVEPDEPDDEVPAGDPFSQLQHGIEGVGTNAVIGIGSNVGGPWGLRGTCKGGRSGDGGTKRKDTDVKVDAALDWLARHQAPDGRWDCDGFSAQCSSNRCSGHGEATHDPGVTGLSLLCFLGRGETHQQGEHKETVKSGLRWLRNVQDTEGCIGPRTSGQFQYDHAIAALALVEGYGMTQSAQLREPAQRAVGFIQQCRNPYAAWRYGIRDGDNDTSVTGWMVMALKSAKMAELDVEDGAFRDAVAWVDRMTDPEYGKVGYQSRGGPVARTTNMQQRFPADRSEALTAAGVLCRVFAGEDPQTSELVRKGMELVAKKLPTWDVDAGTIDMYYWYYGTLASFQVGGEPWRKWNAAMKTAIVDHQRGEADRCERGSWDPEDPWSPEGGRVYSTALMTLCLEVYERYPRVFGAGSGK